LERGTADPVGRLVPTDGWNLEFPVAVHHVLPRTEDGVGQTRESTGRHRVHGYPFPSQRHRRRGDRVRGAVSQARRGTLDVYTRAKRVNVDHLPTLVRTKSNDPESQCPVCYSEWDEPGVIQMAAPCTHCFCLTCIVDVCSLTPPAVSGSCPICRREMALYDLRIVRRERGGTPDNPGGNPPPSRGCCTPCM